MKKYSIGVKYCGNCNPIVDGPLLVEQLRKKMPDVEFVRHDDPGSDLLLIVSSCAVDCATRPDWQGPTLVIAGKTINYIPYEDNQLLDAAIRNIEEHRNGEK